LPPKTDGDKNKLISVAKMDVEKILLKPKTDGDEKKLISVAKTKKRMAKISKVKKLIDINC
jgi:hypothetical protein